MPPVLIPVATKFVGVPGNVIGVTVTATDVLALSQLFKVWDT